MLTLGQLTILLDSAHAGYEIIQHAQPILKTEDAERYFDTTKAAPVFIIDSGKGLLALILSFQKKKIDFQLLAANLGFDGFKLASKDAIYKVIGYEIGSIPLVGHNLPCIIDRQLLDFDFIFGGTGDKFYTLKINPKDLLKLNKVESVIDIPYIQ